VIWSAAADFDPSSIGVFTVYLLDCSESAVTCTELASREVTVVPGQNGAWVESTVAFPEPVDHGFADGRYLGLRIVVSEDSDSDLMFAYGYPKYRSRLVMSSEAPPALAETVVSPPQSVPLASVARLERVKPITRWMVVDQETGDIDSLTPWLATLSASTVLLVILGVVLVFTLSPHGRRERIRVGPDGSRGRNSTALSG
jgi:hypothetical protein